MVMENRVTKIIALCQDIGYDEVSQYFPTHGAMKAGDILIKSDE